MSEILLKTFKEIVSLNPDVKMCLTGSLAIELHGVKTRRPACDIDILIPVGTNINDIKMPEGFLCSADSNEDYFVMVRYYNDAAGIKVEFIEHSVSEIPSRLLYQGIFMSRLDDIIAAKRLFIEKGMDYGHKHLLDLNFMGL